MHSNMPIKGKKKNNNHLQYFQHNQKQLEVERFNPCHKQGDKFKEASNFENLKFCKFESFQLGNYSTPPSNKEDMTITTNSCFALADKNANNL